MNFLLFQKKVQYLGNFVSPEGVIMNLMTLKAVQEWPLMKDEQELRSYFGLCTYYLRFMAGFMDIAKQRTQPMKEEWTSQRSAEGEAAFCSLKESLCMAPVLGYSQQSKKFSTDMDPSNMGIGDVLPQVQEGQEHVPAYLNMTLPKAKRKDCVTQKELLAVVKTKHFHKYLCGQEFCVLTTRFDMVA
jgi:hypothetical protein